MTSSIGLDAYNQLFVFLAGRPDLVEYQQAYTTDPNSDSRTVYSFQPGCSSYSLELLVQENDPEPIIRFIDLDQRLELWLLSDGTSHVDEFNQDDILYADWSVDGIPDLKGRTKDEIERGVYPILTREDTSLYQTLFHQALQFSESAQTFLNGCPEVS